MKKQKLPPIHPGKNLIAEELAWEKQKLIAAYKDAAQDQDLKAEDKIWDETTGDGLENEQVL